MTVDPLRTGRRPSAIIGLLAVAALVVACVPPSRSSDGSVPQLGPIGANGIAFDGTDLWLCDLFGGQLLRIDPSNGRILERVGPDQGIAAPDDLVVTPDGSLIYTSPQTGIVGRIRLTGPVADRVSVLALVPVGVNPIALTPDGAAVIVGYGSGNVGHLDRIDLATGEISPIGSGLPDLNAFSFGPDGDIWAPVGGPLTALTGDGGIIRINIETGAGVMTPLTFPAEPGKRGLSFPVSVKWDADRRLLAVQGIGPAAVYEVDAATGQTAPFATTGADFADNAVTLTDGRTFVSNFIGGITVIDPSGQSRPFPIGS